MKKFIEYLFKKRDKRPIYLFLFSIFAKKYHWYEVKFVYKNKMNIEVFNFTRQLGFKHQDTVLKNREVKTTILPLDKLKFIENKYLVNGDLFVEIICYLGKINKPFSK